MNLGVLSLCKGGGDWSRGVVVIVGYVLFFKDRVGYDMSWYGMIWYGWLWDVMVWYGMVWYGIDWERVG